jgi:hypothetical protein
MTLSEMASAVRNHVADGLNGISSTSFLWSNKRNTSNYLSSNCKTICSGVVDINKLTQRIDGIRIECKDLSANCSVESSIGARIF